VGERIESAVVVIGAGPAGLAAACCLGEAGKEVLIVDGAPRPGGQIWRHRQARNLPNRARRWLQRLAATSARFLPGTSVIDKRADGILLAESAERTVEIRGQTVILATGARELFLPFPGWTLPGVIGVGAGQALIKAGVSVEDKTVLVTGSGPLLLPVAALLRRRGARLRLIAEQASLTHVARFGAGLWRDPTKIREAAGYRWQTLKTPYRLGVWVVSARGDTQVREVELTDGRRTWVEPCDLLCCSYGLVPNTELPRLLGCRIADDRVAVDRYQLTNRDGIYCVGESTGIGGAEKSLVEGQIAAAHVAGQVGQIEALERRRRGALRLAASLETAFQPRRELAHRLVKETIVCRCEDVSWGDLDSSWSLRQAKLYTRLGMGPCQGRICGAAVRHLNGWDSDSVRPPVEPCRISSMVR
jgi:NADPH-dependent 2,4-dienoyl-CoA reductase/sulfur reductase-like enzyme